MRSKTSVFLEANAILCSKNIRERGVGARATWKSLGKVTTKNVTIGVTKVTPQSKREKKNKNLHGYNIKNINMYNILTFILFTFFRRFLLEIVQENRTEAVRPQGGRLKKRKEKRSFGVSALRRPLFSVVYGDGMVQEWSRFYM